MPAPVIEAPAKAEEIKRDERGSDEAPAEATSAPLFGAIAAADPTAGAVACRADLRTKGDVFARVQRTAGNRAAAAWVGSANRPTVMRSCCDGCASGGPCASTTGGEERAEEPAPGTSLQRTGLGHASAGDDPPARVQRDGDDDDSSLLSRIRTRATGFVATIRSAAGRVWDRVAGAARDVGAGLRHAVGAMTARLDAVFGALRDRLQAMVAKVSALAAGVASRLRQGVERLGALARQGWEALKSGARAFAERLRAVAAGAIDRVKGLGRNAFGPMTGRCLDTPTAQAIRARFDGVTEPAEAEVGDAATTGIDDLTAQATERDGAGSAEAAALDATAAAGTSQVSVGRDGIGAAADTGEADVDAKSAALLDDLRARADRDVTAVEGRTEAGAVEVEDRKATGASGLRGLLGGILGAVMGAATGVVNSAGRDADTATSGLRGRFATLLAGLRDVAGSVLEILGIDLGKIAAKVAQVVRIIRDRVNAIVDQILQGARDLVRRGRAALNELRERWRRLAARVAAGWRSLRTFIVRTRSRAATALLNTCGDACKLGDAKQEGRRLDAIALPAISFKARAGGARRPTPQRLLAIQAELEDRGEPLPSATRAPMEAAFGADLSSTRVHTGPTAAGLASNMNARAFTIGDDIAFGHGEFQPGSIHGDALIAHEVAHVLQQRRAAVTGDQASTAEDTAAEHDADHSALAVVARMWAGAQHGLADIAANAAPRVQSGLALRRCPSGKCCETPAPSGPLAAVKAEGNIENPRPVDLLTGKRTKEEGGDVYGLTGSGYGHTLRDMINTKVGVSDKCEQTCKPNVGTYPTFSLSPFFFVTAGRYDDFQLDERTGGKGARNFAVAKSGPCRGKSRPRVTIVTDALAAKVKAAEVEHAKDLARAWDLSIGKYIAAVKELEGGFCVPGKEKLTDSICTEEFRTRVGERSGISWGGWTGVADCLANQSKDRDSKGWHTVSDKTATKVGTEDCKEVEVTPDASVLTNIGTHDTKEIVDDNAAACGAGGGP